MILMLSSMNIMCVFAAAEVKEMMNSNTLQITTQAVVGASMLGDVSTGVFRPLVPIQCREQA